VVLLTQPVGLYWCSRRGQDVQMLAQSTVGSKRARLQLSLEVLGWR
jgi:hypothetical protein